MKDIKSKCDMNEDTQGALGNQSDEHSVDMLRREFMKRFGVYAAGSAVGLYVLMVGGASKAIASEGGSDEG